ANQRALEDRITTVAVERCAIGEDDEMQLVGLYATTSRRHVFARRCAIRSVVTLARVGDRRRPRRRVVPRWEADSAPNPAAVSTHDPDRKLLEALEFDLAAGIDREKHDQCELGAGDGSVLLDQTFRRVTPSSSHTSENSAMPSPCRNRLTAIN